MLPPDARAEYADTKGRAGRLDIEVTTDSYTKEKVSAKAAAGFRLHAHGVRAERVGRSLGLAGPDRQAVPVQRWKASIGVAATAAGPALIPGAGRLHRPAPYRTAGRSSRALRPAQRG